MDFTAEENFPGLKIFIDFQKAFDTIVKRHLIPSSTVVRVLILGPNSFNGL